MSVQNSEQNRPENQRRLNFMSLPNCSVTQNLWLCQPLHPQNIFPSILGFSHKYCCSKYHQHLVAVFQEQPSDIIMVCHQTRGGVEEAKADHCRERRYLYRQHKAEFMPKNLYTSPHISSIFGSSVCFWYSAPHKFPSKYF